MRPRLTLKIVIDSRHDAEQRGFAGTVGAEDADLGAGIKRQPDPAQNLPRWRDDLAQVFHYIDELWRHPYNLSHLASLAAAGAAPKDANRGSWDPRASRDRGPSCDRRARWT